MNLKCLICGDLLTPVCEIFSTLCGHLFHFACLMQWLERSKTCPQCRHKATNKSIHRVYISVEEGEDVTCDASTLKNKLDNLKFKYKLQDLDLKNIKEQCDTFKFQNDALKIEIKESELKNRGLESRILEVREQASEYKKRSKEVTSLKQEIGKLKEELKRLENVQVVLQGSQHDVEEVLRNGGDISSLALYVSTLKKQLIDSNKKIRHYKSELKEQTNKVREVNDNFLPLQIQLEQAKARLEEHKNCIAERQNLKKKIIQLQASIGSPSVANTSIRRIIQESPIPLSKSPSLPTVKIKSPTVLEKVQAIKNSDSPYMRLQSSSVGISALMNYDVTKSRTLTESLLARSVPSEDASYDGLGGHAKDEVYRSSSFAASQNKGIKRTGSSTVTSAKFKRLAPNNQSLLQFARK